MRINKTVVNENCKYAAVLFLLLLTLYPFIFMLFTSGKDFSQLIHRFWGPTLPFRWENYIMAWERVYRYILNSVIASSASVVGVLLLSSSAAYVLARYRFPGRQVLFYFVISLLMVPQVLILVPSFMVVKRLGLLNTRWALILPFITGGLPLATIILRTFFASLPKELFESARIDGASGIRIFYSIALPLCKPILGVIAIMDILRTWNAIIWPLITISDEKLKVITAGLLQFTAEFTGTSYGPMFAGYVLASLPLILLFIFTMKLFIQGLAQGAIKM